ARRTSTSASAILRALSGSLITLAVRQWNFVVCYERGRRRIIELPPEVRYDLLVIARTPSERDVAEVVVPDDRMADAAVCAVEDLRRRGPANAVEFSRGACPANDRACRTPAPHFASLRPDFVLPTRRRV